MKSLFYFKRLFSCERIADTPIADESISGIAESLDETLTDSDSLLPEESGEEKHQSEILTSLDKSKYEFIPTLNGPIVFSDCPVAEIVQFACSCLGLDSTEIRKKAEEFKYKYRYFDDYLSTIYLSERDNPVYRHIRIGYGQDYSFCCEIDGSREVDVTAFDLNTWGKCKAIIFYYYNPKVKSEIYNILFEEDPEKGTVMKFKRSDGSKARVVMAEDYTHPILPTLYIS